jgi:hypothetical protein
MKCSRRHFLAAGLAFTAQVRASGEPHDLRLRVAADGWGGAPVEEVEAVLRSAANVLWKFFPQRKVEPILVLRGRDGPIVHYQRNVLGEIVMKLDTADRLWCQYVYQFSHEFCHVLSGFDDDPWKRNNWFEETLCEVASLFVLRRLADVWMETPPFSQGKAYAPEFRRYAEGVMDSRTQIGKGHLGDYYRQNRKTLEVDARDRTLNGSMAVSLLPLLEGAPETWEAVSWLNHTPSLEGESFPDYLDKWRLAVPVRHRLFVEEIMRRFDIAPGSGKGANRENVLHSRD